MRFFCHPVGALVLALSGSSIALAAAPTLTYAPLFDAAPIEDVDCATAPATPAAELTFNLAQCSGGDCPASIQVQSAGDGNGGNLKIVDCGSLITLSGDGSIRPAPCRSPRARAPA
jgi:hypothetical protein